MKNVTIINGPNLNLLGVREPEKYGHETFESFFKLMQKKYNTQLNLDYYQSNIEGELINKLHNVGFTSDGIIINAGGYSHTSISLRDAISSIETDVVEVHITNIFAREKFRQNSLIGSVCKGSISGFRLKSYELAIKSFL